MKYQLIDIDNCISDDTWRRHLILPRPEDGSNPPSRFHEYHCKAHWDAIRNKEHLRDDLAKDSHLIIVTARPIQYRPWLDIWLRKHALYPMHILMRNNHDCRPSVLVKRDMVSWLLDPNMYAVEKEQITEAIDDRLDIVEMYRSLGIPAKLVKIGEHHADA